MVSFSSVLAGSIRRPAFLFLLVATFSMMGLGAVVIYSLESELNVKMPTLFDALYFVVTTMTGVGFGDIVPVTRLGRLFSMMLMMLGTAIFVCFTAFLSTLLIEAEVDFSKDNQSP